ncbi:phosphoribosylaminoimidazolesuccinocarboxamide synthase [Lottiidibacillus patelloidae]|uniref:Phosphoribosylaminoimidazole-succinocarboxamide synthase n=1 Tax=Lottiidibacillus patelloidae TaxID=2670334 RepID=A0A263BRN8_9BACI|nr:phosphoribosylaminoimidazolesuccinocarboxamide synthase [Lottiidibacillus patelloidae]OZM56238.1 phosphoribosylaminoimidazolesuccinocarboxamide synthase [Lottiidibacillus patelloidae]
MMNQEPLYEGKAKRLFKMENEDFLLVEYKDQATAFNAAKKESIKGKGKYNNEISSIIFTMLKDIGVDNHFIMQVSETEQIVTKTSIIPIEVVVRNVYAGSLAARLGKEEGTVIPKPIVEFYYKDDALGDPLINEDHIEILQLATKKELEEIREKALFVNNFLKDYFASCGIRLIDFKLEFGKNNENNIILADEISPDTCRLWDMDTNERLDKDVFRKDTGSLIGAYDKVLTRLKGEKTWLK